MELRSLTPVFGRLVPSIVVAEIDLSDPIRQLLAQRQCAAHVIERGIEYLVSAWGRVAESVACGEVRGQDDYLNEMDGRHILDEVLPAAVHGLLA
jgi:hypothetical protein